MYFIVKNCFSYFQSTFSCLSFLKVLWPEFSVWHLYLAVLNYQQNHNSIQVSTCHPLFGLIVQSLSENLHENKK